MKNSAIKFLSLIILLSINNSYAKEKNQAELEKLCFDISMQYLDINSSLYRKILTYEFSYTGSLEKNTYDEAIKLTKDFIIYLKTLSFEFSKEQKQALSSCDINYKHEFKNTVRAQIDFHKNRLKNLKNNKKEFEKDKKESQEKFNRGLEVMHHFNKGIELMSDFLTNQ